MRKTYLSTLLALFFFFCFGQAVLAADNPCNVTKILKIGSVGPEVGCIQSMLGVQADGFYGPFTRTAVLTFQAKNGLATDGIVGPLTALKLGETPTISGNFPEGCISSIGYSPLTGMKCDSRIITIAPTPKTTQGVNNPNLANIDIFIAQVRQEGERQNYSEAELDKAESVIRETAATNRDYQKEFDQFLVNQNNKISSPVNKISRNILSFLGITPRVAEAAPIGLPFGGTITYYQPCTLGFLLGVTPLPPTFATTLLYIEGSQAFLSYNLPAARYILGMYTKVGVCNYGTANIPTWGTITPMVGSSPL